MNSKKSSKIFKLLKKGKTYKEIMDAEDVSTDDIVKVVNSICKEKEERGKAKVTVILYIKGKREKNSSPG